MGEWQNTAYVQTDDLDAVERALEATCAAEGWTRVAKPPLRVPSAYDPMQYAQSSVNDLWAAAIAPGRGGWSLVKTAPLELLCEEAPDGLPRLAHVARHVSRGAFQVNLYDGDSLVLVEAMADGRTAKTGFDASCDDLEQELDALDDVEPRFVLLQHDPVVARAVQGDPVQAADTIASALGGANARLASNEVQVRRLIPHEDLPVARTLYFRRTRN
jgi:hypothetical protein